MEEIRELIDGASAEVKSRLAQKGLTLCVLLLDRSGSMIGFGTAPLEAANEFIDALRGGEDAFTTAATVISFADEAYTEIPLDFVSNITPMSGYMAEGMTRLHGIVQETLEWLLQTVDRIREAGIEVKVSFGIVTDGKNKPTVVDEPGTRKRLMKLTGRAREAGWNMQVFGIGVHAEKIALGMGFPTDGAHTHTLEKRVQSFKGSLRTFYNSINHHSQSYVRSKVQA